MAMSDAEDFCVVTLHRLTDWRDSRPARQTVTHITHLRITRHNKQNNPHNVTRMLYISAFIYVKRHKFLFLIITYCTEFTYCYH